MTETGSEVGTAETPQSTQSDQMAVSARNWFSSPWLVALVGSPIAVALLGLAATSIVTVLQSKESLKIEHMKFEYSLIQDALKTQYMDEAVSKLRFYLKLGVITEINENRILDVVKKHELPIFAGAAIKYHLVTVSDAKRLLANVGVYEGAPTDELDERFFKAVADFQYKYNTNALTVHPGDKKEDKLDVDGLLGPQTYFILKQATEDHPK